MVWVYLTLSVMHALGATIFFFNANWVDQAIERGELKVELGEEITGPSYQYAFSLVFGWVAAIAAVAFMVGFLSYVGQSTPLRYSP